VITIPLFFVFPFANWIPAYLSSLPHLLRVAFLWSVLTVLIVTKVFAANVAFSAGSHPFFFLTQCIFDAFSIIRCFDASWRPQRRKKSASFFPLFLVWTGPAAL
jgi:hypothetical protein